MATPTSTKVWTWEEALKLPDGERYEVINGELKERSVSYTSSTIALILAKFLWPWIDAGHHGWLSGEQGGFTIFRWTAGDVRMPDLAYTSTTRLPRRPRTGWSEAPPEFAVEVVSPNDTFSDTEEKARDYIRAGIDLVWVIVPSTKSVHIWRKDGSRVIAQSGEVLSGEDVLSGFSVPVDALFEELD